jgi:hypothetical protein
MSDKEDNSFKFRRTNTNKGLAKHTQRVRNNYKNKTFLATDKGG